MTKKIKLIWDFRGPAAARTAEHHVIHLNEFLEKRQYSLRITNHKVIDEMYALAYVVVEEADMITFRDLLRPHRGEVFVESKE